MSRTAVLGLLSLALFCALWKLALYLRRRLASPLRKVCGPESSDFFMGNWKELSEAVNSSLYEDWAQEFGPTFTCKGLFNEERLLTVDTTALHYILTHSYDYHKPGFLKDRLTSVLGSGTSIVEAEGDVHKNQRKLLNSCFGGPRLKESMPVLHQISAMLRDSWGAKIQQGSAEIEALTWLNRASLDILGLTNLQHNFGSLAQEAQHELEKALETLFYADISFDFVTILRWAFPKLVLPTQKFRDEKQAQQVLRNISAQLKDRGLEVLSAAKEGFAPEKETGSRTKDLLTTLMNANINGTGSRGIADEDIPAQIVAFVVGGHETTSSTLSWCLYELALNPEIQTKLREEVLAFPTDTPSLDDLNSLQYLDAVIRETLRLHAAFPLSPRVAAKDDVIPLKKSIIDKNGNKCSSIRVAKGDMIYIPIQAVNQMSFIWGQDARQFNPERWSDLPETVRSIPGAWGNTLSFLGGSRHCIGFRFAVTTMKILLFTIIRSFEFELACAAEQIEARCTVVQRPFLKGTKGGAQMPLVLRRYRDQSC